MLVLTLNIRLNTFLETESCSCSDVTIRLRQKRQTHWLVRMNDIPTCVSLLLSRRIILSSSTVPTLAKLLSVRGLASQIVLNILLSGFQKHVVII